MTEHWSDLKPEPMVCAETGCGIAECTAVGQPSKNGHPRGCTTKCVQCRNRRNSRGGKRKQAKAVTALGIPTSVLRPGNEEFLPGLVRMEIKSGAQVGPLWTRYRLAEAQSEAARPMGDTRPFVFVAMPEGVSYGLVVVRTDRLVETVAALAEQLGVVT